MHNSGIYCIMHKDSDKFYIGSSKNIKRRISAHKRDLNKNKHRNVHLQNAWNKYGKNTFEFTTLVICDANFLEELEQRFIDFYWDSNKLFNINPNVGNIVITDEIRKSMSAAQKKRYKNPNERKKCSQPGKLNPRYGKKCSAETKAKISAVHKGKTISLKQRKEHSEFLKGKSFITDEGRKRLSESKKLYWEQKRQEKTNGVV